MKLKILYEDKDVLVINKPAGLVVTDLLARLVKKYPEIELVHRLDRDTTGVMILAKNKKVHEFLQAQFKAREVEKVYRLIIVGNLKPEGGRPTGTIDVPIGRHPRDARKRVAGGLAVGEKREAITHYKILANLKGFTYLEARPKTGRTHQLRVHFKYLGFPLVGDKLYAPETKKLKGLARQALHAYQLAITLPDSSKKRFEAPIPGDFQAALDYLGWE